MSWGLTGILLAYGLVSAWRDPRKLRIGVVLLIVAMSVALDLVALLLGAVAGFGAEAATWTIVGGLLAILLGVVVLGIVLVLNGVIMMRREGRHVANQLGLFAGLGLLAYVGLGAWAIGRADAMLVLVLFLVGLPVGYLAIGFVAYISYSAVYQYCTQRWGRPVQAIVVLGSGLIRGKVPPLLASRLDRGRAVYDRAVAAGGHPLMITSGGRGHDEPVAEADAMAQYLEDKGLDPAVIAREDRSRTTEENLANTQRVLAVHGIDGRVAVVTNNFHAFRAALLMRKVKMPGYSLGAPTANYYWPSATIREYVAILRDNSILNVIAVGSLSLPLLAFLLVRIFS
jgi:uncharacterized SAM-binding protein YcdF (DUF218 family)